MVQGMCVLINMIIVITGNSKCSVDRWEPGIPVSEPSILVTVTNGTDPLLTIWWGFPAPQRSDRFACGVKVEFLLGRDRVIPTDFERQSLFLRPRRRPTYRDLHPTARAVQSECSWSFYPVCDVVDASGGYLGREVSVPAEPVLLA